MKFSQLVALATTRLGSLPSERRYLLGITGYPASGKSTFAEALVAELNRTAPGIAAVAPMDGFHMPNSVLDILGLRLLKGAPQTFDALKFVERVEQLRQKSPRSLFWPAFERSIDAAVPDAIEIRPAHRFVVVEGNYLLLQEPPWHCVRLLLDEVWFLDTSRDVLRERLIKRHILGGRSRAEAIEKTDFSDLPNAELIGSTAYLADLLIRQIEYDNPYCKD